MARGGIVDGCFFRDFLSVAAVFVRPDPLRAGLCVPPRLGFGPFPGPAPPPDPPSPPGRSGDFHFLFVEPRDRGGRRLSLSPHLLSLFAEDAAHYPVAGNSGFSSWCLRRSL